VRKRCDPLTQTDTRKGFAFQAIGLIGLLIGVTLIVLVSSLSGYIAGSMIVIVSGGSLLAAAFLLKRQYSGTSSSIGYLLIVGTTLIISGVEIIAGSDILSYLYLIGQVFNIVYVDMGVTISACGCIIVAYSFYILSRPR